MNKEKCDIFMSSSCCKMLSEKQKGFVSGKYFLLQNPFVAKLLFTGNIIDEEKAAEFCKDIIRSCKVLTKGDLPS